MLFKLSYKKSIFVVISLTFSHYIINNINSSFLKILFTTLMYIYFIYLTSKFEISWRKNYPVTKTNLLFSYLGVLGFILINFSIPTLYNLMFKKSVEIESFNLEQFPPIIIISKILLFPFLEELFFRKTILQGLSNSYGAKRGILISAIFFSFAHLFSGNGLLIAFLGGIVLGIIFNKTQNLYHVTFLHILINLFILYVSPLMLEFFNKLPYNNSVLILVIIIIIGLFLIIKMKKITDVKTLDNYDLNK